MPSVLKLDNAKDFYTGGPIMISLVRYSIWRIQTIAYRAAAIAAMVMLQKDYVYRELGEPSN